MKPRFDFKTAALDLLYFVAGSILFGLGIYTFALNAHFAPGGVSGIALIINHFTGLPVGTTILALNVPLMLFTFRLLGSAFMLKSLCAMLINSFFLDVIFPLFPTYSGNPLLAALFTGVLVGAGIALIYMRGSSTGGSDFIIMAVKKKNPHFSVGKINLVTDCVVILAGGIVFGNVDAVLYGLIASFGGTLTMDNVLYGAGSGKLAMIITDKGSEIAQAISVEVERGSTLFHGVGTYTGEEREMVLCACSNSEIYKVRMAARAVDPRAMIMITEASQVIGEGFVPPPLPGNENTHTPPPEKKAK